MRHRKLDRKLGRAGAHRKALVSSLVCSLIDEKRITTTLAKAKAARRLAEKMVTLARKGSLPARRRAVAELRQAGRVAVLFSEIAPQFAERPGGYTRIAKLGRRRSDGSEMAILEWVGITPPDKKKQKKKAEAAEKAESA